MKKTIADLNSKIWYRLLKVVFIFFVLLTVVIFNYATIDIGVKRLDNNKTIIYCTQKDKKVLIPKKIGIEFSSKDFKNGFDYKEYIYGYNDYDIQQIFNNCYNPNPKNDANFVDAIKNGYERKEDKSTVDPKILQLREELKQKFGEPINYSVMVFDIKPVFTYTVFLKNFFIGNLLILLFYEVARRLFYYIVLGTFKPKKVN